MTNGLMVPLLSVEERENPGVGCYLRGYSGPLSRIIAARGSGAVTDDAEYHKKNKVAVETSGAMGEEVFF